MKILKIGEPRQEKTPMVDTRQLDDIAQFNGRSLSTLSRAVLLARGQFALILVRCNYANLQEYMNRELQKKFTSALEPTQNVRELYLPTSISTLFSTILTALEEGTDKGVAEQRDYLSSIAALMVFGLESADALDSVLAATNQVRDEFRKHFPFPVVLWVTDEVLQKLTRFAPDFKSWAAASIKFELTSSESITLWWQTTDHLFKRLLVAGCDRFLPNEVLDLAPGCRDRRELEFARAEVRKTPTCLAPASEATWQFILGRDAYSNHQFEQALSHYRQSATFWEQGTHYWELKIEDLCGSRSGLASDRQRVVCNPFLEQKGLLLFHMGLCYSAQARQEPSSRKYWQLAQSCFGASLEIFAVKRFPELVAQLTIQLSNVLQQLAQWRDLEILSLHALKQPATYSDGDRRGRAYGFLAQVALAQDNAQEAEFWIFRALEMQNEARPLVPQHHALYLLLLGKAKDRLGEPTQAIASLQQARELLWPDFTSHQWLGTKGIASQPQANHEKNIADQERLYLEILEVLRSLYFQQHQYQLAFELKQEQQAIEQLCGLRAFRGAAPLRYSHASFAPELASLSVSLPSYQQEIVAAGRQQDVYCLLERLRRSEHKLTVIHGASGVGKSNLLHAGLVPALWGQIIAAREVIPVIQTVYSDWQQGFCQAMAKAMGEFGRLAKDNRENAVAGAKSLEKAVEQLRHNSQTNRLTALIFDQFEEFFFLCSQNQQQQDFYRFFRDCLNLPYVKVILCLREDYLHYLLRIEQSVDLSAINNNLLDRQIRYSLQDLSCASATQVIHFLSARSQLHLEEALIACLVRDLAKERGTVRPIELQVVGAALQAEKIATLSQYQQLGDDPKTALVERLLQSAIADCGADHENAVWHVLFALTNEQGTRPLRTKAELLNRQQTGAELLLRPSADRNALLPSDRHQRWTDPGQQTQERLDLILTILMGSGLVFHILDEPEERYQLVHDYLVKPIRDRFNHRLQNRLAARLENSETQLVRASQQRLRAVVVGVTMTILAIAAVLLGWKSEQQRRLALEASTNAELIALSASSEALFASDKQFDALLEAMRAARSLQSRSRRKGGISWLVPRPAIATDTHLKVVTALEQAVYGILERNRLQGHGDVVWNASFSSDGKMIAAASRDRTATLWNASGNLLATLKGHTHSVTAVDINAEGLIASSSWDGTLRLWKADGTLLKTIVAGEEYLYSVSFSPDGQKLLSTGGDGTVKLWTREGQLISTLSGHQGKVFWGSFSPDGNTIASAGEDGTVRLWTIEGRSIRVLKGHQAQVNYVTYSPQGDAIATASQDKTVKLWTPQGKLLKTLKGHREAVFAARFSPDGKTIASASNDNTIALWNRQGVQLRTLKGHSDGVTSIGFSPDGLTLVSSSLDKTIELWSFETRDRAALKGHKAQIRDVAFSADGSLLATASDDGTAKLWTRKGKLLATFQGHQDRVERVSFSPDGQWVATASVDKTVKLWSQQGKLLTTLKGHRDRVLDITWSPDSQWLASGSLDKTIKLWSQQGELLATLKGHRDRVNAVTFSPEGEFLASASDDKTIGIWQLNRLHPKESKLLKTMHGHGNWVLDVAFVPSLTSKDAKAFPNFPKQQPWLASAGYDNTVKFWSLAGKELSTLKGHADSVARLDFNPTGEILATVTWDNALSLWRRDDTLLATLSEHRDRVTSVNWSPDGTAIATGSSDKTAIVWNLDVEELTRLGCDWLQDYFQHNSQVRKSDRHLCVSKQ